MNDWGAGFYGRQGGLKRDHSLDVVDQSTLKMGAHLISWPSGEEIYRFDAQTDLNGFIILICG
ncbi:hypothetical protein [Laspinema olomoucense]|uniref:hypothetical protein n=1 Tax=Laspinema olomoucense TaxID=3231600 RepID=UPI0021BAF3BD|nr:MULTISPECIES: hypothetical protein [unclassified Laspinema]MCT7973927.1 hypothetical protein [Laspinema sp. D3d]MCT7989735.1 hypothetical protein [Laspinema sp. D3a]MCT7994048.1 hypothetical protein [Laspinema sp. D3c]